MRVGVKDWQASSRLEFLGKVRSQPVYRDESVYTYLDQVPMSMLRRLVRKRKVYTAQLLLGLGRWESGCVC